MQSYQATRMSGVAWIGKIPSDWKQLRGKFVYGNKKQTNKGLLEPQRLALTLKGVIEREDGDAIGLNPKSLESYQIFETNDLVFKLIDLENKKTSRVGLVPMRGIMSPAYIRLIPRISVCAKYFYYYYYSLYLTYVFNNIAGEGVRANLSSKELLEIPVILPSNEVQERIANYLDEETAKIDNLISKQEQLIELLEEKRRATITNTVTRGLNSEEPMKDSGIEWLGEIPEKWSIKPLFSYVSENNRSNKGMVNENVLTLSYGKIKVKNIDNGGLMPESFETYQVIKPGDIILRLTDLQNDHRSLRVGHSVYEGIITSAYVSISSSLYFSKYLYYMLHAFDLMKVFYNLGGGLRQGMKYGEVKRLPAFNLSELEQREIVAFLEKHEAKVEETFAKIKAQIALLRERRSSLIANVVTGKVKV